MAWKFLTAFFFISLSLLVHPCPSWAPETDDDGAGALAARSSHVDHFLDNQSDGTAAAAASTAMGVLSIDPAYYRVLSTDGGGVRGIFPGRILLEIENQTKKSIYQLFRGAIGGTSTGSIIAFALAVKKHRAYNSRTNDWDGEFVDGPYAAEDIVKLYDRYSKDMFSEETRCSCCGWTKHKYSNSPLRRILTKFFGDQRLGDTLVPVRVVAYNIAGNVPVYFDSPSSEPGGENILIVEAILASSAAPTYFPAVNLGHRVCVDGGLYENNPALTTLIFAQHASEKGPVKLSLNQFTLLSLGTCQAVQPSAERLQLSGKLGWVKEALDVSMNVASEQLARHIREILGDKYLRVQRRISPQEAALDDYRKLRYIQGQADDELAYNSALRSFIETLKSGKVAPTPEELRRKKEWEYRIKLAEQESERVKAANRM